MIKIDGVEDTINAFERLSGVDSKRAIASGLTRASIAMARAWEGEIFARLDRPMSQTLRSVLWKKADPTHLQSETYIREGNGAPINWLSPNEFGGTRQLKRFEVSLQAAGAMPRGWKAVPTRFTKMDSHGNISRSELVGIVRDCASGGATPGYAQVIAKKNSKRKRASGKKYFAFPNGRGKLKPGVYIHNTKEWLVPVLLFKPAVTYRRILGLEDTASQISEALVSANVEQAANDLVERMNARNGRTS